jgi:hypothetical protein
LAHQGVEGLGPDASSSSQLRKEKWLAKEKEKKV